LRGHLGRFSDSKGSILDDFIYLPNLILIGVLICYIHGFLYEIF
jgi:hypothetical protein